MSRGELPGDADLELLIDLIVGPVYYRLLTRAGPVSLAPEGLVDVVLAGCPTAPGVRRAGDDRRTYAARAMTLRET